MKHQVILMPWKELRHDRQNIRCSIRHLMHSDGWAYLNMLMLFVELEQRDADA